MTTALWLVLIAICAINWVSIWWIAYMLGGLGEHLRQVHAKLEALEKLWKT